MLILLISYFKLVIINIYKLIIDILIEVLDIFVDGTLIKTKKIGKLYLLLFIFTDCIEPIIFRLHFLVMLSCQMER